MKNNIETRKNILNKLYKKAEEEQDDVNFAEVLESSDVDKALDDYIDSVIANELSNAFLED